MKPVTRDEQYLNRLTGEEQEIPEEPVTREEQYLARLCGQTNSIPEKPVTRREEYLANLCGEDVIIPEEQVTRMEQYMAFAAGARETKPEEPVTREEWYWDKYQGGDVPEEKTIAFTDIITVTDALARPAVDLQTEITATQNLNGYEYPWVGGAGKNKLEVTATTQTINGVTFTINSDGTVSLSGTASQNTVFDVATFSAVGGTAYKLSGCPSGGSTSKYLLSIPTVGYDSGSGYDYIPSTSADISVRITIYSGQNTQGLVFKPMICLASAPNPDYAHYAPYENICPISGRTEVNVTRTGVNVWDEEWKQGDIVSSSGIEVTGDKVISKNYCEIKPNTSYYIIAPSEGNMGVFYYDENKTFISMIWSANRAITTPSNAKYFKLRFPSQYGTAYANDGGLLYPSTATAYEPYEGDTFNTALGQTVYGGTLDVTTGELTITHAYVDLGDLTWTTSLSLETPNLFEAYINNKKDGYTNFTTTSYRTVKKLDTMLANGEATGTTITIDEPMAYIFVKDERATTAADFKTLVTGQKMVYELAEPQTVSLTPTEVMMLENNNTIWADSGRVQLTYLSKAAEKVQLMNASLKANTLKLSKGAIKE